MSTTSLPSVQPCTNPRHTGELRARLGCVGPDPVAQRHPHPRLAQLADALDEHARGNRERHPDGPTHAAYRAGLRVAARIARTRAAVDDDADLVPYQGEHGYPEGQEPAAAEWTPEERALADQLKAKVRELEVLEDARRAARTYRAAADEAHAEGDRLYDDMGQKAAEGAWKVRDLLRARADELEAAAAALAAAATA
ncbi:hypothetical protein ABZ468_07615 [Streptomyces sp. NPDC005708]|uniref:hypothetical protein n=1 Tax=Streptomyces sp. NPDC005708 TaxID=3154564 RepID=UPI00340FE5D4